MALNFGDLNWRYWGYGTVVESVKQFPTLQGSKTFPSGTHTVLNLITQCGVSRVSCSARFAKGLGMHWVWLDSRIVEGCVYPFV